MSSLHDHVAENRARDEAETALLKAITKAVAEIEAGGGDVDIRAPRLKALCEAYALVVHGTKP